MRGFFVTGTDTGIGKTIVSASLICALRDVEKICYWKPIQTGIEKDNDTETVKNLANLTDEEIFDKGFRLEKPLSPHLSAKLANIEITVKKILRFIETDENFWIVEGAGGVFVPLNENELMIDLMKALNLPVLIVARSSLGTINHTLLTIEALRKNNLKIFGVILNGELNKENRRAIEHFGKVKVLAEMPKFEKLEYENLKSWTRKNLYGYFEKAAD
ncbi:MAG: dethiobiotin synthase [Acidobacteria bacterium]|jgi:dethiobiotin synthase|nr:dethiobiotin synthase [Acidobacteriota bacterium]